MFARPTQSKKLVDATMQVLQHLSTGLFSYRPLRWRQLSFLCLTSPKYLTLAFELVACTKPSAGESIAALGQKYVAVDRFLLSLYFKKTPEVTLIFMTKSSQLERWEENILLMAEHASKDVPQAK